VLWQNGLLGYADEAGRRRFYSMGDIEEFHFPPDVDTYVLHPCLVHAVGGIQHVPPGADRPAGMRRAGRPTTPERNALRGAPAGVKAADYAVGDVLEGRFEILDLLGEGGFSKVYRVRDDVEGEERALKLFDAAAGDGSVRREIAALRKIHHPNVVEVFWAGKTAAGDWYLITEFVDGESLDEFVSGQRHLRDREAVDVALDLLEALVAFHPGLVHRDIKPLNVMLTRSGAKLLDFNIASRVGDPVHTQSGTPPYQPPDASPTHWDVSTDLFAVGVLLYQLLCNGTHPFPNALPALGEPVIDPRTIRPDLDPGLAEFLIRACAPASADRFATAAEMRAALRSTRAGL
jgi:serine/threonine protein kinase